MSGNTWKLQDAKNKFSNFVKSAQKDGPQIVTKHGKKAIVILAFEDFKKLSKPKIDFYKFLQKSPLANLDLKIDRNKDLPREINL